QNKHNGLSINDLPFFLLFYKSVHLVLCPSEVSTLIHEKFYGTYSGWALGQPSWNVDLHEKYNRFSKNVYFGISSRLAYDIKLGKSIVISPQYQFYFGLTNEFQEFPYITKSMRHCFCIGIEKAINSN
ncbi:MAG: hypothetical protein JXR36_16995, partial [Bacteroidales bacterium]|nr:hypothetical protein [Bacteroidales bacterium]